MYKQTLVGQSAVAKTGEILADIAMYTVVPGGAKGLRFVAGSAMGGAFVGGMQATEDGGLRSRVENAAFGAVEGAVGGYFVNKTAQGLHWVWKEGKVQYGLHNFDKKARVPHVFSKGKGGKVPKYGHVLDTSENRRIIVETYMDKKNFIGEDIHGNRFFAKLLPDGRESWVEIYNKTIKSAGINDVPLYHDISSNLTKCKPLVPKN